MTPEELKILEALLKTGQPELGAASPPPLVTGHADYTPPAPAAAPPEPEQVRRPPPAPETDQYEARAGQYRQRADQLDQEAQTPYPKPQGVKEHIVSALRAGMESFGRLGAPGGYYGQEKLRQEAHAAENADRLKRAQMLRNQAGDEEQIGISAGNLDETRKLRGQQELNAKNAQANADRDFSLHKSTEDRLAAQSNRPDIHNLTPGEPYAEVTNSGTTVKTAPGQLKKTAADQDKNIGNFVRASDNKHVEIFQTPDNKFYMKEFDPERQSTSGAAAMGTPQSAQTAEYIAAQVRENPQNWSLASGNKALQDQVRAVLAKDGENVNLRTAGERDKAGTLQTMLEDVNTLSTIADHKKNAIGPVQGNWQALKRATIGTGDDEINELFRLSDSLAAQLLYLRSGAQINEKEYARLRPLMPDPRGPEDKFFSDLRSFKSELERTQRAKYGNAGQMGPTKPGAGGPPAGNLVLPADIRDKLIQKPK